MYKKALNFSKKVFNNHFELSITVSASLIIVLAVVIDWLFTLQGCPMCILTRYVFGFVAISGFFSLLIKKKFFGYPLIVISSVVGMLVTSRQIYIQNMSVEEIGQLTGCGLPFHMKIEYLGIIEAVKETLEGGPSCAEDGMRFLFNFAEWGFIFFFVYLVITIFKIRSS